MKVRDAMNHQVRCCSIDDTLNDAARIMWEHDIGFLPVVDAEGCVVGVVTDRDICMAAYTQGVTLSASKVASAMAHEVISVHPDDSLHAVERIMSENQIRRVPVLDRSGQPLGVIALADLARHGEQTAFRKALEALGIAKTLAAISGPHRRATAAE